MSIMKTRMLTQSWDQKHPPKLCWRLPQFKRLLPCLLFFLAAANCGWAQGYVTFQNSSIFNTPDPTGGNRLVYDTGSPLDPVNGVRLAGTQWVAELYVGADAASLSPVTESISRFRAPTSTTRKGMWSQTATNSSLPLPFAAGTAVTLMVKVWDFSQFPSYEAATANGGLTGTSEPFTYVIPAPAAPVGAASMEGLRAFALGTTPLGCERHKAAATAQLTGGVVVGVSITNAGCGYTNAPAVLIQGGGGTGATATAVISNSQVVAINITSGGCCYTNPPLIVLASPWFKPTVNIAVKCVKVIQHVVLGRQYVLESSYDSITWTPTGSPFIATSETTDNDFDVGATGGFFRVREVP